MFCIIRRPELVLAMNIKHLCWSFVLGHMAKRHIMRIDLSGAAKKRIGEISDRYGMTQLTMMSRMVEWYEVQSPEVQHTITTKFTEKPPRDIVKKLLTDMAAKK